jgi:hypothetical protein
MLIWQSLHTLTPENAKRLLYALQDNVNRFEDQFGQVKTEHPQGFIPPIGGVKGEA